MQKLFNIVLLILLGNSVLASDPKTPEAPSGLLCDLLPHPEWCLITDATPDFGWVVNFSKMNEAQTACEILVSSDLADLLYDRGNVWDSGKVRSAQSINVKYGGEALHPSSSYWWKVRAWDREDRPSPYSQPQLFNVGELNRVKSWPGESRWVQIPDPSGKTFWSFEDREPVTYHPIAPVKIIRNPDGTTFLDFGRAAFSALDLTVDWQPQGSGTNEYAIRVGVGEMNRGNAVEPKPPGGIIHAEFNLMLKPGKHTYSVNIPRFKPVYPESQVLPPEMREVIPYRYCQIFPGPEKVIVEDARQLRLHINFDDQASSFVSSSTPLNEVYDLCKYSIKVNTFNGDYAGSERERMLYEADAYIQQMGHYAIDREYAIARYSAENLIYHATWPTEWSPHCVFMAYADYLYTGNTNFISQYYDALKSKTLLALTADNDLTSTTTGLQTPEFLKSIHYSGKQLKDIVDWPPGETDGFVFCPFNSVVNAFHYRSLVVMGKIAAALDKTEEVIFYQQRAERVKIAFNKNFLDPERGIYRDGVGTDHISFHANLFALAFGLVPEERRGAVIHYLKSRGMACSVYPTVYLLEALYDAGEDQYALDLMTSTSDRSWLNMIRVGSTVTTEAWDVKYKVNEGWTHAWSTAPVQIISRELMGIEPLEPGFAKVRIEPRPGNLANAKILVPTIRGPVSEEIERGKSLQYFKMTVSIPANMKAQVALPLGKNSSPTVVYDGHSRPGRVDGDHVFFDQVGPGKHTFYRE